MKSFLPTPPFVLRFALLAALLAHGLPCALAADADTSRLEADSIDGVYGQSSLARGNAVLTRDGRRLQADWLRLFQDREQVEGGEHSVIDSPQARIEGGAFQLDAATFHGQIEQPRFQLQGRRGRGEAVRLLFEGEGQYRLQDASFTSCQPEQGGWRLRASEIRLDYEHNYGVARHGRLEFYSAPLLYAPWADFTLDGSRKSGVLPPTLGYDSQNGADITLPYYFNLAPNYDLTLSPRSIARRGVQLGGELRWLHNAGGGEFGGEWLGRDAQTGEQRDAQQLRYQHTLPADWRLQLNLQRTGDDAYLRDLDNRLGFGSQTQLPREATLSRRSSQWAIDIKTLRYQTLQDPAAPLALPYDRLPQISFSATPDLGLSWLSLESRLEATRFAHVSQINGERLLAQPSLSLPLTASYGFLRPRLSLRSSHYQLSQADGGDAGSSNSRVPIYSVDSGLIFEREFSAWGGDWLQTLEPRLYYLRAPVRDQASQPNFDSAVAELNYGQLFNDNRYTGGDRVGDANELTLGLSSSLFENASGVERLRLQLGQRFYFAEQQVTLPGEAARSNEQRRSDLLAGLAAQLGAGLAAEAGWQYNPQQGRSEKLSAGFSYAPQAGKALSLRYRLNRSANQREIDLAGQWPLTGGWYGVARHNYSLELGRPLESVGGLEYNAGCWTWRLIARRSLTTSQDYRTGWYAQLELTDLGQLGRNPLDLLRDSIPGYSRLTESSTAKP